MHPIRSVAVLLAAGLALPALPAAASGFGLFQHGGRTTGQAGAFVARASDPSAVTFNPAAITRLDGFQLQAGLDFNNATDTYESRTGTFSAHHVINFPPSLYATWTPGNGNPWAFGVGLDSSYWLDQNWDPNLFPARFLTRRLELEVFELHPVVAYDLGDGWSVGGGLRYLYGSLKQGVNGSLVVGIPTPSGPVAPNQVEIASTADADVDALAFDLALHYAADDWGWGAVLKSNAKLEGSGDVDIVARDVPAVPGLAEAVARRTVRGSASQSFELPWEADGGVWFAPYPELRLELDAAFKRWSDLDDTAYTIRSSGLGTVPIVHRRDWDDTLSLRLGVEGDVTDAVMLYGGLAWEPSPVPGGNVEPGFPRGDAYVYAVGATYNFPQISFDLGYSFHDHQDRQVSRQEAQNFTIPGTYSARDQVWSASARWRF
jgi:long-chain fatty acid transport protein